MARNRISTNVYNDKVNYRINTREQMIKDQFGGKSGPELEKEINKALNAQYVLDTEFKKKFFEFSENTKIIGAKKVNEYADKYLELNGAETIYRNIGSVFTDIIELNNVNNHLKKNQTGMQLIENAKKINGINYTRMKTKANSSVTTLKETYENFKNVDAFYVFDTETLSGMGKTGYNELDSLQEIAFRKFKKIGGKVVEDESARIETLIGISKEQYDRYMDVFINNFDNNGWEGNQKYKVIAERFAKLGHLDTKIDYLDNGIAITKSFASDESKNLMDSSNIKRGIERAYELGKRQREQRLSNGLMTWEDQLLRSVSLFNNEFVAGYNSTNFDFEKMNQSIAKVWSNMNTSQRDEYSKIIGLKAGQVPTINPTKGNYLDFRDVTRIGAELTGKTGLYELSDLEKIKEIGKTLLQQESLGEVFAKDAFFTAAHTAGADVTVLANLLAGDSGNGKSLYDNLMSTINTKGSNIAGTVDSSAILMATQGEFFNDFTRKGALNFTHDRSNGIVRTFNGYSIGKDTVENLGKYGKATGIKKDVAYQIGFMGELDMSEKFIKEISGIHQDYAQGKLWAATFNPLIDKNIAGNNSILEDPTTYLFTSKEAMEGFVSSHFTHIGNKVDGKITALDDAIARAEVQKLYSVHTIKDGVLSQGDALSIDDLIANGTKQLMNDSAARMIRENEFTKAVKFGKVQDYLIKNGATTIEQQKQMLSLATAQEVASGKALKIRHDIESILGFTQNGDKKLYSSTLNNTINGYEYISSQRHIMDKVIDTVNGYGNIGSEQKQYLYNSFMSGILNDAEKQFGSVSQELKLYGKDLNYFEFDMPSNYFKHANAKSMPGEIDNVLRINLEPEKEYSLVNDLIRRRRNDDRILKSKTLRQAYGKQELINFVNEVNSIEEYSSIFGDQLNEFINADIDVDALSEKIILALKDAREKSPGIGYSKTRDFNNVLGSYAHELDNEFIAKSIDKTKGSLANLKIIDTKDKNRVKSEVEELVDEVLMPTLKTREGNILRNLDEIVAYAEDVYGYNKDLAQIFKYNLQLQRESHIKGMTNLVKGVANNGGKIAYDTDGQLAMIINNEVYNLFGLARTEITNETYFTRVGNDAVASGLKWDSKTNHIVSNLEPAYDHFKYLDSNMSRAISRGEDPAKIALSAISRFSSSVRDLSSLGPLTTKDAYAWQSLDLNDLIYSIPDMMNKIESYDGWHNPEMVDIFKRNAKSLKNGYANSEVMEAFVNNKQDLLKIAMSIGAGQENSGLSRDGFLLSKLSNYTQKLYEGKTHIGEYDPIALIGFEGPARPPVNAADAMMYNKADIDKMIENSSKLKGRIETSSRLVSERQLAGRHLDHVGEVADSFSFKSANISEKNFKNILHDHFQNLANDPTKSKSEKDWYAKIYSQMKSLNITEQGKVIDGYVASMLLNKTETQRIGTYKNFVRDLSVCTTEMQDRINKAMPKIELLKNTNEITFKLGEKSYVKRGEALLSTEGFGGVIDTIGVKEDAGFFGFNYTSKNTNVAVSEEEISKFLNSKKKQLINEDGTINTNKAMTLLNKEFSSNFFVENAFEKGYNKGTSELSEKGMYEAMLSGAGTLDTRIKLLLEKTGMDEAQGKILGDDFVELLEDKFNALPIRERQAIGFTGDFEEVKKAIKKEKFAMSDEFRKIEQLKDVTAVALDNIPKHGNLGIATKQFLNNIAEYYMGDDTSKESRDRAYKKLEEVLKSKNKDNNSFFQGINVDYVDGKIVFKQTADSENTWIDKQRAIELAEEFGIYSTDPNNPFAIVDNGEVVGFKTTSMTMFNNDFSGTSRSNHRLNEIKSALDDSRETYEALTDPEEKQKMAKKVLKLEREYDVAKKYNKSMKISSRELDMLSLYSYEDKLMSRVKERLVTSSENEEVYKKIFNRMLDDNGNLNQAYSGKKLYNSFIKDIEEEAYNQAVGAKEVISYGRDAIKFNISPNAHLNELLAKDFEVTNLDDLAIPMGDNTKFLLDNPNRSFGRNIIIDTGVGNSNDINRYVAISANDYALTGDTVVTDDVQKALVKLKMAKEKYQAGKEGSADVLRNGTTVKDLISNVHSAVQEVKEASVISMKKHFKGLDTVKLGGYSYDKASVAMLHTDDLKDIGKKGKFIGSKSYSMYGVSEINGKTIGQWASEGIHYDASWNGRQYFRNLGYYDKKVWKDKFGFESIEQLEKYLSEHGTLGIELRTPTIMEGSTAITRQFLDVNLKDGQTKVTSPTMLARNQDQDGDSIIKAELRHRKSGLTLAEYNILKQQGKEIDSDAAKYFEELNAAITIRATINNKNIYDKKVVDIFDKKEPKMAMESTILGTMESSKVNINAQGKLTPFSQLEADSATTNIMLKRYNEIENEVLKDLDINKSQWSDLESSVRSEHIHKKISSLGDDVQDTYYTAARFKEVLDKGMGANMSKTAGKASIGYINTPLATMRRYAANIGMNVEQRQYLQFAANILEQNIISKKHSDDYNISLAQTFRGYISDITEGKKSGLVGVQTLIQEHYAEDIVDAVETFGLINNKSKQEILQGVNDAFGTIYESFTADNKSAKILWKAQDIFRNLGTDGAELEHILNADTRNSTGLAAKAVSRAEYGADYASGTKGFVNSEGFEKKARRVVSEAGEAIQEFATSGGGLAKAALGIAAAVMMTGYIGGNPTIAPGTEAEDLNQYDSLQDEDLSIQSLPQGTGQGYVVNINAQSAKGQDHAMQAIQKAMQSSVTTDINISMNISDKTSNINSRFIDSLLAGAL